MDMQKLFSLKGKVALVTGGAYGIGFAMAEALANAGAKIALLPQPGASGQGSGGLRRQGR